MNFDTVNNVVYVNYYTYDSLAVKTDSVQSNHQGKNKYTYLSIPLLFGYEITLTSGVTLNLRAGIDLAIQLKSRGRYINNELSDTEKANIKATIWNYRLSPELEYPLTPKMTLAFNPTIIFNAQNIFKQKTITQKYINTGISIGVKHQF